MHQRAGPEGHQQEKNMYSLNAKTNGMETNHRREQTALCCMKKEQSDESTKSPAAVEPMHMATST